MTIEQTRSKRIATLINRVAELEQQLAQIETLEKFATPIQCEKHGLVPNLASFDNACPNCKLEAAEARVAELETAHAWRPIESAPKDRNVILAARGGSRSYEGRKRLVEWVETETNLIRNPTHWQPLPEPPNAVDFVAEAQVRHTTEDDYQHFLSYSGLTNTAELQLAYYAGAGETMECAPSPSARLTQKQIADSIQRKSEDALKPMSQVLSDAPEPPKEST